MKEHSNYSRNNIKRFLYPLLFSVFFLMLPVSIGAQSGSRSFFGLSSPKERGVQVSFANSPACPEAGVVVQVADNSGAGSTSWFWSFNAGTTSMSQNPSDTFEAMKFYNVTLMVTNDTGSDSTGLSISVGQAEVITAASASFVDVSAAVSKANAGDTVIVPAGSATWTSQLLITKGIYLIGAGIGQTVITSTYGGGDYYKYSIIYQPSDTAADVPFRLSGFDISCGTYGNALALRNATLHPLTKTRIDHNRFQGSLKQNLIIIEGHIYGVGDNNVIVFDDPYGNQMMDHLGRQADSWNNFTFTPGTADNFYWEDNNITTGGGVSAGGQGGRYCFRYNTITSINPNTWQAFDAHGNSPNNNIYATMGHEIYENTIITVTSARFQGHRGGIGIIFNNTVTSPTHPSAYGFLEAREEYNDNTCPTNGRTDGFNAISGQPQHVSGSYYWNNLHNGTVIQPYQSDTVDYGPPTGIADQENVDWWQQKTPFTGSAGVGVGLLSARPSSGLTVGVGYWATDTRTLYRATSATTWETYYTPYTYPHPLRNR